MSNYSPISSNSPQQAFLYERVESKPSEKTEKTGQWMTPELSRRVTQTGLKGLAGAQRSGPPPKNLNESHTFEIKQENPQSNTFEKLTGKQINEGKAETPSLVRRASGFLANKLMKQGSKPSLGSSDSISRSPNTSTSSLSSMNSASSLGGSFSELPTLKKVQSQAKGGSLDQISTSSEQVKTAKFNTTTRKTARVEKNLLASEKTVHLEQNATGAHTVTLSKKVSKLAMFKGSKTPEIQKFSTQVLGSGSFKTGFKLTGMSENAEAQKNADYILLVPQSLLNEEQQQIESLVPQTLLTPEELKAKLEEAGAKREEAKLLALNEIILNEEVSKAQKKDPEFFKNLLAGRKVTVKTHLANSNSDELSATGLIAMCCNGGSSNDAIIKRGVTTPDNKIIPYDDKLKVQAAACMARGLAGLDKLNIRHRDLKPDNILFNITSRPDGKYDVEAYISDLGVAYSKKKSPIEPKELPIIWLPQRDSHTSELSDDIYTIGLNIFQVYTGMSNSSFRGFVFNKLNCSTLNEIYESSTKVPDVIFASEEFGKIQDKDVQAQLIKMLTPNNKLTANDVKTFWNGKAEQMKVAEGFTGFTSLVDEVSDNLSLKENNKVDNYNMNNPEGPGYVEIDG